MTMLMTEMMMLIIIRLMVIITDDYGDDNFLLCSLSAMSPRSPVISDLKFK
jgi:hypothetical protein